MAEVRFLLCRIYSFARMAAPGCFGVVARGTKIVPALHDLWGLTLRAAVWQEVFYKSFDFGYSVVFTIA